MEKEIEDLKNINLHTLAKMAAETQTEITVKTDQDRQEIQIAPWKPFEYKCQAASSAEANLPDMPEPGMEPVRGALGINLWERVFILATVKGNSFADTLRELTETGLKEENRPYLTPRNHIISE